MSDLSYTFSDYYSSCQISDAFTNVLFDAQEDITSRGISTVSDYRLDDRCSIPGKGKGFFF
jgi:hypothetical protein